MTQAEAYNLIALASVYMHSADPIELYFWLGYKEGVRRALHGPSFNADQHRLMMLVGEEEFDDGRRARAKGYRAGLAGLDPRELDC